MKNFDRASITLFDSTNANFKLAVEAQFTRGNRETGYRDIVYITDRNTAILNPNIYLTFAYKGDDVSPVYTSYPQLFRIREAFEKIKNYIVDGSGFVTVDNVLVVRGDLSDPVVVANIGKNNNWISLKLIVAESDENGILTVSPCVAIELSSSNRFTSILTTEEFLTIYSIIKDLNLSTLQCMLSLSFLSIDKNNTYTGPQQSSYGNVMPPIPSQPQQWPTNQWSQPQQPQWQPPQQQYPAQQRQTPKYNNQNYRSVQGQTRQVPPPPMATNNNSNGNNWPTETNPFPTQFMPERSGSSGSILSKAAVENTEVPVETFSIDDASAIDDIFNEN